MSIKEAIKETFEFFSPNQQLPSQWSHLNLLGAQPAYKEAFLSKLIMLLNREAFKESSRLVIVLPQEKQIGDWLAMLSHNLDSKINFTILPHTKYWASHRFANQVKDENDRLRALGQIAHETENLVIFTSLPALMQRTCSLDTFQSQSLKIELGSSWDMDDLADLLVQRGYQKTELVSEPGYFAIRGGIIDVFSCCDENPTRIEFFSDEVSSIRWFSPTQQRSLESRKKLIITLAQESTYEQKDCKKRAQLLYDHILIQDHEIDKIEQKGFVDSLLKGYKIPSLSLFLPLFREKNSIALELLQDSLFFFPDMVSKSIESYEIFSQNLRKDYEHDIQAQKLSLSPNLHFGPWEESLLPKHLIQFGDPMLEGVPVGLEPFPYRPLNMSMLKNLRERNPELKIILLSLKSSKFSKLEQMLEDYGYSSRRLESSPFQIKGLDKPPSADVLLALGSLERDLFIAHKNLLLLPSHLLFGEPRKKTAQKTSTNIKAILDSFRDLKPGSLIVHMDHGIGRFMGMSSMSVADITTEFIEIEYEAGDKIYLPIDKLALVQKYASGQERQPRLDRLKSQGWQKRKTKAKSSIKQLAINLLEIHAKRKLSYREPYSPSGEIYFQFEADFPFEETVDQDQCIADVQKDLSKEHPMDRLICGDVGFGKTEIALRAAMRVVLDGFQVMLMAPTTVLSFQHFQTFRKRFKNYAINIGLLNRFVSPKSAKATRDDFAKGGVDILIGTHRILSKDVSPKNLGLVIIDEEQRFGVAHKETLKTLRSKLDILSLSATPIPRSLHMAMLGIKDISILMTPPRARLPIKTFISPWNEAIIEKSIAFEIKRGGQVFFVHNRVDNILEVTAALREILPEVSFRVGHGQMAERELEKVILNFLDHKFSVLVCTTIIESGIDMPNVNTILINQAERYGLAQLYQMRGRVGRSSRQSYAYFLTSGSIGRNLEAQQRLEVLAAHQELGAGFQVASYDLEMRGAGDLLGADQSGRVNDIGIDLYMELLEQEILKLQGKIEEQDAPEPEINININAFLPQSYIVKESLRLSFYKKLFSAKDEDELSAVTEELEDRFGALPQEAKAIISIALAKMLLKSIPATALVQKSEHEFELKFSSLKPEIIEHITKLPLEEPNCFFLKADYSMMVKVPAELCHDDLDKLQGLVKKLRKIKGPPSHV